jgi:FkbM family methyltransferase
MRKAIAWAVSKTGGVFNRISRLFYSASSGIYRPALSLADRNKKIWYSIDGDHTLRVKYPLEPSSVVIDVGGYEGDWAAEMQARYGCTIHIFEPVSSFVNILRDRFSANPKIMIHDYGLSNKDEQMEFNVMDESSSAFTDKTSYNAAAQRTEKVQLRSFTAVMDQLGITSIDIIKINIEGGEYPLIEQMIETGFIKKIDNLQIQFHDFVPEAEARMNAIKQKLSLTHELTYEYIFVWENWKCKPGIK